MDGWEVIDQNPLPLIALNLLFAMSGYDLCACSNLSHSCVLVVGVFFTIYYLNLNALVQCVHKSKNCDDHNYPLLLQALILMSKVTIMWSNVIWKHLMCVFCQHIYRTGITSTNSFFHV